MFHALGGSGQETTRTYTNGVSSRPDVTWTYGYNDPKHRLKTLSAVETGTTTTLSDVTYTVHPRPAQVPAIGPAF